MCYWWSREWRIQGCVLHYEKCLLIWRGNLINFKIVSILKWFNRGLCEGLEYFYPFVSKWWEAYGILKTFVNFICVKPRQQLYIELYSKILNKYLNFVRAFDVKIWPSALADLGGVCPACAPPFAWHPSSLADLGGAHPVRAPPFAWHPSFWWYFGTYCIK